jgi:transcriptional regulator with XRE-family HTH domain
MDEALQADICARIRQARIEAGFTQEEAADVLDVTQRAYFNYEHSRVPFRLLTRIADAFGVTEGWLIRGGEERRAGDDDTLAEIVRRLVALEEQVGEQGQATTKSLAALAKDVRSLARRLDGQDGRATKAA